MNIDFTEFVDLRVLVIGDVMLDQYWWGRVDRISPEAPVPVVALEKKSFLLGGAANVAANVSGLGAHVSLIGGIGNDDEGSILVEGLDGAGIENSKLLRTDLPTCVKTRIVAAGQQVVRVDSEASSVDFEPYLDELMEKATNAISDSDIIVISDYAKGIVGAELVQATIARAHEVDKLVLVDPKGKNYEKYRGADILTPNEKEAFEATRLEEKCEESIELVGQQLVADFDLKNLVITRGNKGMMLFSNEAKPLNLNTEARNVFDVTGAGDTVIASLAVAIGCGASFLDACDFANASAGIVVESLGTTSISKQDLEQRE